MLAPDIGGLWRNLTVFPSPPTNAGKASRWLAILLERSLMSENITARMKWIVKKLRDHPGAIITNRRDWFLEKSFYTLEWNDSEGYHCVEVTNRIRKALTSAKMIAIVEERPVYSRGEFRTTERDYGLPKEDHGKAQ